MLCFTLRLKPRKTGSGGAKPHAPALFSVAERTFHVFVLPAQANGSSAEPPLFTVKLFA
jgi:hypothetical protein